MSTDDKRHAENHPHDSEPESSSDLIHTLEEHNKDTGADINSGALGKAVQFFGFIFAIGIVLSAVILVAEVFLRYVFNAPTIWAHETVIFLNACAFVYGGLYAASRNEHIRVVLIYDHISEGMRRIFNIVISIICMIATGMFAWAAWLMVKRAIWRPNGDFNIETSGSAWNPPLPGILKMFLLFILAVMCVQFLIFAINYFRQKGEE